MHSVQKSASNSGQNGIAVSNQKRTAASDRKEINYKVPTTAQSGQNEETLSNKDV